MSDRTRARAIRRRARSVYGTPEGDCIAIRARWVPATLGVSDIPAIVYALALMALLRGLDYFMGEGLAAGSTLSVLEAAAPLWAWGWLFSGGGVVLGLGAVLHRHGVVWLGHAILSVAYLALTVGTAWMVVGAWSGDGARYAGVLLLPSVVHILLAIKTGPRPLRRGRPSAVIVSAE